MHKLVPTRHYADSRPGSSRSSLSLEPIRYKLDKCKRNGCLGFSSLQIKRRRTISSPHYFPTSHANGGYNHTILKASAAPAAQPLNDSGEGRSATFQNNFIVQSGRLNLSSRKIE